MPKRLLLALAALAIGIFAVLQSLNAIANRNREQVYQELQKLIGASASFDGFEASLWGGLAFTAREFRIADNPRFAATPLLHATELTLGVSLWQLLLGRVVIDSLTFHDPEFQIITDETGLLNVSALRLSKRELAVIPTLRTAAPDRGHPAVSFLVTTIRLENGRVDFLDRSVKEPAEMQIRNVDMEVNGLDPAGMTEVSLTAALTEGLKRDVKITGRVGPIRRERDWLEQAVDLELQFDSLYVAMLARAMPFLRNQIPPELDVAGPMSLHAKLSGSFAQPRLRDLILKVPLFGSSDYNAVLQGTMELPENRSWDEAEVKGRLTLDPVNLTNLRALPFLKQMLPAALVTEGPMSVFSQFEGSWEQLRIGALIKADKSELRYRQWLRKPAGTPARLRAKISRQKKALVLHESDLSLGNSAMTVSGFFEDAPEPRVELKFHNGASKLATWSQLVSPLSFYGAGGEIRWDIALEKKLADAGDWNIRGQLKVADAALRHKESGRKIDHIDATIAFLGNRARVESASFLLGSSRISLQADIADLPRPSAGYKLWSAELNPMDLPGLSTAYGSRIKNLTAVGELKLQEGALWAQGSLSSPEGILQQTPYRNLRGDIAWSPAGISFKNLSLQAFNGSFRLDGFWHAEDESPNIDLVAQIDSLNFQSLMSRLFPELKNRLEGELNFRGRLQTTAQDGQLSPAELKGSGETEISGGTIKDFNLIAEFFSRGEASAKVAALLPQSLTVLLDQADTPFDTLKASFTVEQQRIRANNLLLSTADYTVTAVGWLGFDGETKWTGSLVLAPRVTQELQRENKMIRYLLDRRGRLSLSFRADGTLPNLRFRPENRALGQVLRSRSPQ